MDLAGLCAEMEGHRCVHRLSPVTPVPAPEVVGPRRVGRGEPQVTLAKMLGPVSDRLDRPARSPARSRAPLRAAGATLAAESGLVMGYMSQRVLGQYELSLLGPRPTRGSCSSGRT